MNILAVGWLGYWQKLFWEDLGLLEKMLLLKHYIQLGRRWKYRVLRYAILNGQGN